MEEELYVELISESKEKYKCAIINEKEKTKIYFGISRK